MELYSKVNDFSSENSDKKTLKFSTRYQFAAFGKWLFNSKFLTGEKYNASLVGRSIMAYYHIEKTASNEKAFRTEKSYEAYLDYYRPLLKVIEKYNSNLSN
jgi:hypothetical protein